MDKKHICKRKCYFIVMLISAILLMLFLVLGLAGCTEKEANKAEVDINNSSIAVVVGTWSELCAEQHYPDADIMKFDALSDSVIALQSGNADFVITAYTNCLNFKHHNENLVILPNRLTEEGCAIAINKSEVELSKKISDIINQYNSDGTLETLISNWINTDDFTYVTTEIPEVSDGPILDIAICADREPMCFVMDGHYAGLDIDIVRSVAYDLGMKPVFHDTKYAGLIPSVVSGKTPIAISNISATDERKESVNFSPEYFFNPQSILTRTDVVGVEAVEGTTGIQAIKESIEKSFVRESRWKLILSGIGITIIISLGAAIFGGLMGFGICMLRRSRRRISSGIAKVFIRLIQGTPIVVLLMIFYYVIFNKSGLDGVAVAIIAFGINFAAYSAEILRSGIDAVDTGQLEAAAAIGFNKRQTFLRIVFPQAARHFLPVLKGEFISLVKMTSVVGYVAIQDLTRAGDIIRSRTFEAFFPLIVTAIIYFLLSWGLASILSVIEIRISPKYKRKKKNKENTLQKQAIAQELTSKGGEAE